MIAQAAVTRDQLQERFESALKMVDILDDAEVKAMYKKEADVINHLIWYFFEYDNRSNFIKRDI